MEIIIHRGTHQIGGCATEIKTEKSRIFIDFGAELDNETAKPLDIDGITKGKSNCDGVFFTHYHGDHIGLLDTINSDIPLYMGSAAKEILTIYNNHLAKSERVSSYNKDTISSIRTFDVAKKIVVGDITITPFCVDHSAYDAYMFLIEADGKKILHTGDFRGHGFRGKGLLPTLEKYVGKVDILICEGTTLNRTDKKCMTENELKYKIKEVILNNKYVFVVCSSTNIDRIASVCSVVPRGKYCLCDKYQKSIIDYISKTSGEKSSLYKFKKCKYYGENIDETMEKQGFCMFVRSGNSYHKAIMEKFKDKKPVVIYSMWKGYLEQESMKSFLTGYKRIDLHTSGHADVDTIKSVIDAVNPEKIIPVHTEVPDGFLKLINIKRLNILKDGEIYYD